MDIGSTDVVFCMLCAFTTYAVFCVTLLMLIQNYRGITAQQQTQLIAAQLKMQVSQYERLLENIESTARLRHDWRHHLLSINSYVETGWISDLKKYLEALNPVYTGIEEAAVCQNHIVDVNLQHYAAIAKGNCIPYPFCFYVGSSCKCRLWLLLNYFIPVLCLTKKRGGTYTN